jgi:hypothetical protein
MARTRKNASAAKKRPEAFLMAFFRMDDCSGQLFRGGNEKTTKKIENISKGRLTFGENVV